MSKMNEGVPLRDSADPSDEREAPGESVVPTVPVAQTAPHPEAANPVSEAVPVVPVEASEHQSRAMTPVSFVLAVVAIYFLYKIQIVVVLLIVGIIFATAIARPVELLHRRGLGRGPAILIVYLAILGVLAGIFYLLIPPVAAEATRFARAAPDQLQTWRAALETHSNPLIRNAATRAFQMFGEQTQDGNVPVPTSAAGAALGVVSGIGGAIVSAFTLFLIAFYWISERALIKRAVASLFRASQRRRVLHLWDEVEAKLGAWIRGQLLLMAVVGVLATAAYGIMDLPFWLLLGVIAGLTEAIPNVGPVLGAIPAVLVALTVDWKLALVVVGFVTVLQLLENAVLVPRIMKGTVGLSPLTVILAILAGSEFRGVIGALLAVPIAGAISVILADALRQKHEREAAEQGRGRWFGRMFGPRPIPAAAGRGVVPSRADTGPQQDGSSR
jgi:predicted PurR-regulated permease PerM